MSTVCLRLDLVKKATLFYLFFLINEESKLYFFFKSILFSDKGKSFWISLNDIENEGHYVWLDGTNIVSTKTDRQKNLMNDCYIIITHNIFVLDDKASRC